jgi:hypothetical protein
MTTESAGNEVPRLIECSTLRLYLAAAVGYVVLISVAHAGHQRFLTVSSWWLGVACGVALDWLWRRSTTVGLAEVTIGAALLLAHSAGEVAVQLGLGMYVGLGGAGIAGVLLRWPQAWAYLQAESALAMDSKSVKYLEARRPGGGA